MINYHLRFLGTLEELVNMYQLARRAGIAEKMYE